MSLMIQQQKEQLGFALIAVITVSAVTGIFSLQPIAQDLAYHHFADTRTMGAIPNGFNIVSNLPFLMVGILGLYNVFRKNRLCIINDFKLAYITFFTGIILMSMASSYYHHDPNNQSLVWDRLFIALSFMALFAIVIAEFISLKMAKILFLPFLFAGITSVFYWQFSENEGAGDLRFYILIQFYPLLVLPVILSLFQAHFSNHHAYGWLLLSYIIAKLLEHVDVEVYTATGIISGHSAKHLVAALGLYLLVRSYQHRHRL
ncbi:MAG: alkaline phytoceramidase [Pseudomonadales bacterium]|nr:alkaline phytoceramidase [Pseudomonadales bacterium]